MFQFFCTKYNFFYNSRNYTNPLKHMINTYLKATKAFININRLIHFLRFIYSIWHCSTTTIQSKTFLKRLTYTHTHSAKSNNQIVLITKNVQHMSCSPWCSLFATVDLQKLGHAVLEVYLPYFGAFQGDRIVRIFSKTTPLQHTLGYYFSSVYIGYA
jgi:hypothetical protein